MNGIILYKSKYGGSQKYAHWIGEEIKFETLEVSKAKAEMMAQYDTIILCGGIYASSIAGISFLKKNYSKLSGKKIAVLGVGASPDDETCYKQLREHNFKGEIKNIPLFYARGAWNEGDMSFKDKSLCKLLQKAVSKKDPATYEPLEKVIVEVAGQKCDWRNKSYLDTLFEFIKKK